MASGWSPGSVQPKRVSHGRWQSPSAASRRRLVGYMKEHFRDDERGKRAAFYFLPWAPVPRVRRAMLLLPWHFNFWTRYRWLHCSVLLAICAPPPAVHLLTHPLHPLLLACRPMPEAVYGQASLQQPLLSTRWDGIACTELGETVDGLPPLERLLRCENEAAFGPMAEALWEAASDAEAEAALLRLAADGLQGWEEQLRTGDGRDRQQPRSEQQAQG